MDWHARRRYGADLVGSGPHRSSARFCSSAWRCSGLAWKLRNTFSTRITAESTMMPKSTAPTDNRLASSPISTRMMMLKNSANGMLTPTMMALRRSPRKTHWMRNTSSAAEDEIVQDGVRGDVDQRGAVVERNDLHPRRQRAVAVDLFDLALDARHHVVGVQRPVHHQDGRDHVVFVVAAGLAEPRHVADVDLRHVLDLDGHAVELRQRNVLDVVDLVALRQVACCRRCRSGRRRGR